MTDTVDGLIAEIHTELDAIVAGSIDYSTDERKVAEHDSPPRIVWVDAESRVEDAQIIGGNDGNIGVDVAVFDVHVWHSDRENARNLFHNLVLAARNICYGPNLTVSGYSWVPLAYSHFGRTLVARFELSIPISAEAAPTATVTTEDHEVIVDGEVVC